MQVNSKYFHTSHSNHLLQVHLILCVKYRKRLLTKYGGMAKEMFTEISRRYDLNIVTMEVDKDHMQFPPTVTIVSIVRRLKPMSTHWLWKLHESHLKYHFWSERTFWSGGYFVCSTGDASASTIKNCIESQG